MGLAFQDSLYCRYKNNYQHKQQSVLGYVLNKSNEPLTSSVLFLSHDGVSNCLFIHRLKVLCKYTDTVAFWIWNHSSIPLYGQIHCSECILRKIKILAWTIMLKSYLVLISIGMQSPQEYYFLKSRIPIMHMILYLWFFPTFLHLKPMLLEIKDKGKPVSPHWPKMYLSCKLLQLKLEKIMPSIHLNTSLC